MADRPDVKTPGLTDKAAKILRESEVFCHVIQDETAFFFFGGGVATVISSRVSHDKILQDVLEYLGSLVERFLGPPRHFKSGEGPGDEYYSILVPRAALPS